MATAMDVQNDDSTLSLTDDVLLEIFSYLPSIKEKILLEKVSHQFKRVSKHPTNWKEIRSLELMMKCSNDSQSHYFETDCDLHNVHLNGMAVRFENWPSSIEAFLKRTQLHHFSMHFGYESYIADPNSSVIFSHLNQIFAKNKAKITIVTLEIHSANSIEIDRNEGFKDFFRGLFKLSTPYLQVLRYFELKRLISETNKDLRNLAWPIIKNCSELESVTFFKNRKDRLEFDALMGKPLTEIIWPDSLKYVEQLVAVINGVSSDGVESFTIESCTLDNCRYLSKHLTEKAKNKLKYLSVSKWLENFPHSFAAISSTFPNIEEFDVSMASVSSFEDREVVDNFTNKLFTTINSYLMDGSVTRRFTLWHLTITTMNIPFDMDTFQTEFTNLCQNGQIDVEFGQMPFMHLSKGNASFMLQNIKTYMFGV